jgi:hypothetical protein
VRESASEDAAAVQRAEERDEGKHFLARFTRGLLVRSKQHALLEQHSFPDANETRPETV